MAKIKSVKWHKFSDKKPHEKAWCIISYLDKKKNLRWLKSSYVEYRNGKFYERDLPESSSYTKEYVSNVKDPNWTLCWINHYEYWKLMYMISLEEN